MLLRKGEIKIILKKDDEKKSLGAIPFDIADYANQKKETFKIKAPVQDLPSKV
jgi:hypothetical protein